MWNELVDKSIRSVGGYWPPLAGVARLLEELGEVAVELRREPRSQSKLAEELADVFFISTCLANQYVADLNAAYVGAELNNSLVAKTADKPAPIAFLDLLSSAGSLARTVNLYEGSKPLKPDEQIARIGESVARLHRALSILASASGIQLADEVRGACERKSKRDRGRFKTSHDASLCPALDEFRSIQSRMHNSNAMRTRVWGASPWVESDRRRSVDRIAQELSRFIRVAPHEFLEGFVVHLLGQPFGQTVAHVAAGMRYLLSELGERDVSAKRRMAGGFEREDWSFEFAGQYLLIDLFAPSLGSPDVFIFFGLKETQALIREGQLPVRWWEADISLLG
jgi:NTP pyrophosphatase (non-canonical NTP hydrolase)